MRSPKGNVFKSSWSSKLSFVSIYTPQQAEKMYPYYTTRQPEFSNADCLIEKVSFTNLLQHVRILGENIISNDDSLAVKWHGSATKASLKIRRGRSARDTIYFYIGVWIFHDIEKNAYPYCS
ncbi:hypothetical protein TSAR_006346 [Trichomalopsis sarcophagae]|uniref:Uncharacterized protein n=1 Tax=Trichomalopsis sarcophagae TaxID=543379 RepID=A0A232FKX0_9HYME|nr:hypothetical protein TSAR_006346 [Trichomalopsis sarcophagae]